jgi:hypothetical protein
MKKILLPITLMLTSSLAFSQWNSNTKGIYFNQGLVSIGDSLNKSGNSLEISNVGYEKYPLSLTCSDSPQEWGRVLNLQNIDYEYGIGGSAVQMIFDKSYGNSNFNIQVFSDGKYSTSHLNMQTYGGNVGIGTYSPEEKLTVKGNILIEDNRALILTSPNGSQFQITVDDDGRLYSNKVLITSIEPNPQGPGNSQSITTYPNPTKDLVYINTSAKNNCMYVSLYNIQGQHVYTIMKQVNSFSIDMKDFAKGVYVAEFKDCNQQLLSTQKIIKD